MQKYNCKAKYSLRSNEYREPQEALQEADKINGSVQRVRREAMDKFGRVFEITIYRVIPSS